MHGCANKRNPLPANSFQVRRRLPDGSLDIEVKQMAMDERNQAQGFGRSNGSRGEREEGFAPRERRSERGGRSSDRSPSLQPVADPFRPFDPAAHGWCPPDSKVYNEAQAEKAWSRMLALFKTALV